MFEIISLGRMDFLIAVLNGLAILTSDSGPAGYGGLVALGLLIGVVLALARAIVTQRLELQWVLAGWLLFAGLFVPKVTVTVEDVYTGATTTVANVPLGPAAIGSITSTIGVTLADAFGAVFAFPSLTKTGYMDSLELINALRDVDYGAANDGNATAVVSGVDLQRSLRAYLIDCVYYDMSMDLPTHDVTVARLRESADLLSAIRVNSNTWFTTVYLVPGDEDGQTLTCAEAHSNLSTFMRGPFVSAWQSYIGSLMGVTDMSTQLQGALDALFGVGHDAQTYMLNSLIKRELELAEVGFHAQGNNAAGVLMRVQAMEQRRTQWAAEQSMWAELARPAIAFIEGFFYAVSPFMGFLFTLGAPGISLFARYLLLAVWIQLWMPVLAITNLYISIAASHDLQHLATGGTDPLTLVGLDSVWTETASWLAFGGSMVAATPLLTLILVTGSYFALTTLTSRMNGGDHVDERIQSPDILSPAAVAASGAMGLQRPTYTSDPMQGLHMTGVPEVLPRIEFGTDIRASVESAVRAQHTAEENWSKAFSGGLDLTQQRGREQFVSNLMSHGLSGSSSQTDGVIERMARSAVANDETFRSWSEEERASLQSAIGAALQAGKGVEGKAGVNQALANIRSLSDTQRKAIAERIDHMVGVNSDEMAQLAEKVQQDASVGASSRFFGAMQVSDSAKWAKAYQESKAASESYARSNSLNDVAALRQSLQPQAIGYQASRQGWADELQHLVALHHLDATQIAEDAGFWSRQGWMDHETALATAATLALAAGPAEARMDLAELLARNGFAAESPSLENPRANEDMARTTSPSTVSREVEGMVKEHSPAQVQRMRQDVSGPRYSQDELEARGLAAAQAFFEGQKERNTQRASAAMAELDKVVIEQKAQHYESTFAKTRSFLKAVQDFDMAGNFGDTQVNVEGLKSAGEAYSQAYDRALASGHGPASATVSGLLAGFRGYGQGFDKAVAALHEKARAEVASRGLPDVVAQYYADEHMLYQEGLDVSVPRLFGQDAAFEERKAQAREILGDSAFEMLRRAARSEPVAQRRYLDGAVAIYQSRALHAAPAPAQ